MACVYVCAPCAGLEPAEGRDEMLSWEVLGAMTGFSAGAGCALSTPVGPSLQPPIFKFLPGGLRKEYSGSFPLQLLFCVNKG